MMEFLSSSSYFGLALSVGAYILGSAVRRRWNYAILNPLLLAIVLIILLLSLCGIPYRSYDCGAKYLSYFLTPATVCLALPLYRQLPLLKKHAAAILCGISAGVAASAASVRARSSSSVSPSLRTHPRSAHTAVSHSPTAEDTKARRSSPSISILQSCAIPSAQARSTSPAKVPSAALPGPV